MMHDPSGLSMKDPKKDPKALLPTFIYDYFRRNGNFTLATAMLQSDLHVNIQDKPKTSPNRSQVNGVDDGKDGDKEEFQKRMDSLPLADVPDSCPETAFLLDWWSMFWDHWTASGSGRDRASMGATQYLAHATVRITRMLWVTRTD